MAKRNVVLETQADGSKVAVVTTTEDNGDVRIQRQPVTLTLVLQQRAGLAQQKQNLLDQIVRLDEEARIWQDIETQLGQKV